MNVNAEEQPQLDLIVVDATTISTDINEKRRKRFLSIEKNGFYMHIFFDLIYNTNFMMANCQDDCCFNNASATFVKELHMWLCKTHKKVRLSWKKRISSHQKYRP